MTISERCWWCKARMTKQQQANIRSYACGSYAVIENGEAIRYFKECGRHLP